MPGSPEWFQFHTRKFWGSRKVRMMDYETIGMYLKLLSYQWEDGPIPKEPEKIASIIGIQLRKYLRFSEVLLENFEEFEDGYLNLFLEEVRFEALEKINKYSRAGKKGADARWAKRDGDAMKEEIRPHSDGYGIREDKIRVDKRKDAEALIEKFGNFQAIKKTAYEVSSLNPVKRRHVFNKKYDEDLRKFITSLGAVVLVEDLLSLEGRGIDFPLDYCMKEEVGKRVSRWEAASIEASRLEHSEVRVADIGIFELMQAHLDGEE